MRFALSNKKKGSFSQKRRGDAIFVVLMLAVPVIWFIIFWGVANFGSLLMAFQQYDEFNKIYWTMENFVNVVNAFKISDNVLTVGLRNTLISFVFSMGIMFPFSFALSYFIYKKIKGYKFFRVIFYAPQLCSAVALVMIYKYMIGTKGPVGLLWSKFIDPRVPNFLGESEYALKATLAFSVWTGFCGNLIYFSGAMAAMSDEMLEAAIIDGATMKTEFFRFVIPLCWPTISTMVTFNLIGILGSSPGPTLLLTNGAADTYTLSFWMFQQVLNGADLHMPAALGWIMTLVTLPIIIIVRKTMNKVNEKFDY